MSQKPNKPRFHLLDAAALVVGYSLASMLVRAYWPGSGAASLWEYVFISVVFVWLGLAMSGPVLLMIRRSPKLDNEDDERPPEPRSWSELAWLIIGFYWIGLTILVVPARDHQGRFIDSAILGIFPILAALVLRFMGPATMRRRSLEDSWTHKASIGLLLTWPFAWVALIVLGKALS